MEKVVGHFMDSLIGVWTSQERLPKVIRWGLYLGEKDIHRQCLAQHVWSVQLVAAALVHAVRDYVTLDSSLLLHAFLVHDHGEAELGRDHAAPVKRDEHDLEEYNAFVERFRLLDEPTFQLFHRAFLLQFALPGKDAMLPEHARAIIRELAETRYPEAVAFRLIELLDYLAYAEAQRATRGIGRILVDVIERNMGEIDHLAPELPGFQATIWTPAYRKSLCNFVSLRHADEESEAA